MRTLLAILFFCGCLPVRAAEWKPVATVRLPCESPDQHVSPSGEQVAVRCSDRSLRILDIATGREQRVFPSSDGVTSYTYSRDGRWLAVGLSDGSAEIVAAFGSGEPKRWKTSSRLVEVIEFLGDDDSILVAGSDEPGKIWDVSGTPTVRANLHSGFAGLTACKLSSDGKQLATAEGDTVLRVYDTSTWKVTREYTEIKLETFALAFTTNGKYLLAGGANNHISVIDLASGTEVHLPGSGTDVVGTIIPLDDNLRAAVWYSDVDGRKPDHQVMWNLETRKAEPLINEGPLTGVGVVRGKLRLVSATGTALRMWEYQ